MVWPKWLLRKVSDWFRLADDDAQRIDGVWLKIFSKLEILGTDGRHVREDTFL